MLLHFFYVQIKSLRIPLPALKTQRQFIAEIGVGQVPVNASRALIVRFEKKIQATLARMWGEAS